jgi:alpha-glucosidase
VLAYLRKTTDGSDPVLVALNMSAQPQTVSFQLKGFGVNGNALEVLLESPKQGNQQLGLEKVQLAPFAVLIADVK